MSDDISTAKVLLGQLIGLLHEEELLRLRRRAKLRHFKLLEDCLADEFFKREGGKI